MAEREIGAYRIKEQIPFRGPGRLFGGVHAVLGRKVAIRDLCPGCFADPTKKSAFLRAARIVQRHAPPGVANVHLCEEGRDRVVLVTEFYPASLEEVLQREGGIPLDNAIAVCTSILQGVKFLHGNGIAHGNISTESVVFAEDGTAKVADWGITRRPDLACYLPPESAAGQEADASDDLYAVGVLLRRLAGEGVLEEAPSPARVALAAALAKALSLERGKRFQSAGEFLDVLQGVPAEGGGVDATLLTRQEGEILPLLRFPGRRVPWVLLFGLMLIPLALVSMTRKSPPLPQVPHKPPAVQKSTEGDAAHPSLPGLLPVRKEGVARERAPKPPPTAGRPAKEPAGDSAAQAEAAPAEK